MSTTVLKELIKLPASAGVLWLRPLINGIEKNSKRLKRAERAAAGADETMRRIVAATHDWLDNKNPEALGFLISQAIAQIKSMKRTMMSEARSRTRQRNKVEENIRIVEALLVGASPEIAALLLEYVKMCRQRSDELALSVAMHVDRYNELSAELKRCKAASGYSAPVDDTLLNLVIHMVEMRLRTLNNLIKYAGWCREEVDVSFPADAVRLELEKLAEVELPTAM